MIISISISLPLFPFNFLSHFLSPSYSEKVEKKLFESQKKADKLGGKSMSIITVPFLTLIRGFAEKDGEKYLEEMSLLSVSVSELRSKVDATSLRVR